MQRPSPKFRSQQFSSSKICGEVALLKFIEIFYGQAIQELIRMGSSIAAGNQQTHLSLSFAAKA